MLLFDELTKFNPCHDADGKFCSSGGGKGFATAKDFKNTPNQAADYTDKLATKWEASLSTAEKDAIGKYTEGGAINKHLRAGTLTEKQKELVANIDSAIAKFKAPEDFVTYRAVGGLSKIKEGSIVTDSGFVSTGTDRRWFTAGKTSVLKARILVKQGASIGPIGNPLSRRQGENEILLPRNSKFKVVSKTTEAFLDPVSHYQPEKGTRTVKYTFVNLELL